MSERTTELQDGERIRAILAEFVHDIDITGGIRRDRQVWSAPFADPDWIDLGETYLNACQALGRKPKIAADNDNVDHGAD